MGFLGERWIYFCISTVKFSILVNRSPVEFFSSQKGLRQGDPLSCFLFLLAMEGLSKLSAKPKELHRIQGFQVGSSPSTTISVSHLLYADDALIFCGADGQHVFKPQQHSYGTWIHLGPSYNMLESTIYPVNEVTNLEELPNILSCKRGSLPTTYFGIPLGAKSKSSKIWSWVIGKMELHGRSNTKISYMEEAIPVYGR